MGSTNDKKIFHLWVREGIGRGKCGGPTGRKKKEDWGPGRTIASEASRRTKAAMLGWKLAPIAWLLG